MNHGWIVDFISTHFTKNRLVIGIDGMSRSGKTTLSAQLGEQLTKEQIPFITLHIDDHITMRANRYDTGQEEWYEYYELQWDVASLRSHLFEKLRTETHLSLPFYVPDVIQIRDVYIPRDCVILIEGVFLQRPAWRSFYDYIFYVDCPQEVRFARESEEARRDLRKLTERYWKAEAFYTETVRPREQADYILESI